MTVGVKNKCTFCKKKLLGCKLKDIPHIHAEINGMAITAKIHQNDELMKFLQKLESTPYEPSMKSLEGECKDGLCREKSYYDIRGSPDEKKRGRSRSRKSHSYTSWFRKRIGSQKKRTTIRDEDNLPPSSHSLERSSTPTEPDKDLLVLPRNGKKTVVDSDEDIETSPYTSLKNSSPSSSTSDSPKKSKKPSKRKSKPFLSKRKKSKPEENTEEDSSVELKKHEKLSKRKHKKSKTKKKTNQTAEIASAEEENLEGDSSVELKKRKKSPTRKCRKTKKEKCKTAGTDSTAEENSKGDSSVESKKRKKFPRIRCRKKKNKQKQNKTAGRASIKEENTEEDASVESKKHKKSWKRNSRKSKTKEDKKCQTSMLYQSLDSETKLRNETVNYARLMSLNRYQTYQIPKNPLVTLPVLVNLKHLFHGKKSTNEKVLHPL